MSSAEIIPGPAYRIITTRLVIRCADPKDAPALHLAIQQSLDHLRPWVVWVKEEPAGLDKRIDFLRQSRGNFDLGTDFTYLVFNPAENFVIGGARLSLSHGPTVREIGYWIHKAHINQGYATEVAAALTKVAFEIDHVSLVEIHCSPKNIRSAAVPKKLAFTHEATLHNRVMDVDGNLRDSMVWSLFEADYPNSPSARVEIQAFEAIGRRIL